MLGHNHYYHRLIRKYVILFGNLFNNIYVVRYNSDFTQEIERFPVPIQYGPKENFVHKVVMLNADRAIQVSLPRMAFEITGLRPGVERMQNAMIRYVGLNTANNAVLYANYLPVPYDIDFVLNIVVRNVEDGAQIVEQILPFFKPDFTPTANLIDRLDIPKDVRIEFNGIDQEITNEGPMVDTVRTITWILRFTMHGFFFGPTDNTRVVRSQTLNFQDGAGITNVGMNLTGNGFFTMDDFVYSGPSEYNMTAYGDLVQFYPETKELILRNVQGTFRANDIIRSSYSNGVYSIVSFTRNPENLVTVTVTPRPNTAFANGDFGFSYDQTTSQY